MMTDHSGGSTEMVENIVMSGPNICNYNMEQTYKANRPKEGLTFGISLQIIKHLCQIYLYYMKHMEEMFIV